MSYASIEDDGDVDLAIQGADGSTQVADAPDPTCTHNYRTAIAAARFVAQGIRVGDTVAVRGAGFFDFFHNQNEAARNQLELHPLQSLKRLG